MYSITRHSALLPAPHQSHGRAEVLLKRVDTQQGELAAGRVIVAVARQKQVHHLFHLHLERQAERLGRRKEGKTAKGGHLKRTSRNHNRFKVHVCVCVRPCVPGHSFGMVFSIAHVEV